MTTPLSDIKKAMEAGPLVLASLRHLYANMTNGGVRDTASATRIATGLLGPQIERLETIFGLLQHIEALEADAARHQWLRRQYWNESSLFVVAGGKSCIRFGTDCPSGDRLDAAIDSARSET